MVSFETKQCNKCGFLKPTEAFNRDNRSKDGFARVCRECRLVYQRAWIAEHRPQVRASQQKYDLKNRDVNLAIMREWRAANPDRVRVSREKWIAANPEKIAAAAKRSSEKKKAETKMRRSIDLRPREIDDTRRCSSCLKYHAKENFGPAGPGQLSIYCKPCLNRIARDRLKKPKNRANAKKYADRFRIKKLYGMTIEDIDRMMDDQDNKCAICREPLVFGTGGCSVDHDHGTNVVRGLLCRLCNVGLGHFRENEMHLNAAIRYLQRARGQKNAA